MPDSCLGVGATVFDESIHMLSPMEAKGSVAVYLVFQLVMDKPMRAE